MKRILFFLLLVAIAPVVALGQNFNSEDIVWKKFQSTLVVENKSIVKDLRITPVETSLMNNEKVWASVSEASNFSLNIKKNTCKFWFITRVSPLGATNIAAKTGTESILSLEQKDYEGKLVLVWAEFRDPSSGSLEKKLVQLRLTGGSSDDGVKNYFLSTIDNEALGLNVLKFKFNNDSHLSCFLENKQLGIKVVINGSDDREKEVLASSLPAEGVYTFNVRLDLPFGISSIKKVDLFIKDGEIAFKEKNVNPLSFGSESIFYSGKKTLVKFVNTRSEPITIIIPKNYVAVRGMANTGEVKMISPSEDSNWSAINIAPGRSAKITLTSTLAKVIVKGKNSEARFEDIFLTNDNFQVIQLGW